MGILRLLLAIAVVLAHSGPVYGVQMTGGVASVQTFYMISGFYMAMVLSTKYTGPGSIRVFYTNRFLKIFPLYWTILAISAIYYGIIAVFPIYFSNETAGSVENPLTVTGVPIGAVITSMASQIFIFGQDIIVFLGISDGKLSFTHSFRESSPQLWTTLLVPQAWSLGLELDFYLIAPALIILRTRYLFAVLLASVAVRACVYRLLGWDQDPWTYRFFPSELALFVAGMISYRIYAAIKDRLRRPSWVAGARIVAAAAIASTALYSFVPLSTDLREILFLLQIFASLPALMVVSSSSRLDRGVGELSFGVYVVHFLILAVLRKFAASLPGTSLYPALGVLISIVAALALNAAVYRGIRTIRERNIRQLRGGEREAYVPAG